MTARLPAFLFDELKRFPDDDARDAAFQRAHEDASHTKRYQRLTILNFLVIIVLVGRIPATTSMRSLPIFILIGLIITLDSVALYLVKRDIHRSLWKQLADLGVPCCLECGYDLTGNVSGVCPECGIPVLRSENKD